MAQDRAIRQLRGLLRTGRIPSGLLFHGQEGVGKKKAALALAQALVCARTKLDNQATRASLGNAEGTAAEDSCGACETCIAVDKGLSLDVRVVDAVYQAHLREKDPKKAFVKQQEWGVDTIRQICLEMQHRSFLGNWKVALVDDAHRMNPSAQNALLKMLEEPPPRTLWILVTAHPGKLLPTVLSRTHAVRFAPLGAGAVERLLVAEGLSKGEARELSQEGSVAEALKERDARELYGDLKGPLAPFKAAGALPRELAMARQQVGLALDHFSRRCRNNWVRNLAGTAERLRELQRLRGLLRRNVSPSYVLQLAFLEMER